VFFDVDTIPLGVDFRQHIETTIANCDAALVIIGPRWLTVVDDQGRRRLDNAGDFVRMEVAAALRRKIPVVPLLVDGGTIPEASQIPASIAGLTGRNGIPVRHDPDFHSDLGRLIRGLENPAVREPENKSTPAATAPPVKAPAARKPVGKNSEVRESPVVAPRQEKAVVRSPRHPDVRADLPFVDAVIARQSQPVGWFARQRATVSYDRAKTSERKGDLDAAIVHATEAIGLNPKLDSAFWFRGDLRERKGDFDGAIADYTEAFRLNPGFALALYSRGRAREGRGDLDGATADYEQCVKLAPTNVDFKEALQRLRGS
jgi:hypothetical protein